MKKSTCLFMVFFGGYVLAQVPSGEEILAKVDKNYEAKKRVSVSKMSINGRRGTRTIKTKSWAQGEEKAFTQYLEPAREKDTKMLKLAEELWIWSPATDRIIKIAGHMLRQSMNGSDISYEDFMQDPVLKNSYAVEVLDDEKVKDRACYVLYLSAKKEELSYCYRKIWVDKERFLPLKEELYAKSKKLLKLFEIRDVMYIKDRWYPKNILYKDVLMGGSGTEILIESIDFDADIPAYMFTKASLKR